MEDEEFRREVDKFNNFVYKNILIPIFVSFITAIVVVLLMK